jgi:hypothetical protein
MIEIKPPQEIPLAFNCTPIFLGGTIDMGNSYDWQTEFADSFSSYPDSVVILNPRRNDWDSSWKQDPTPGTKFYEQVMWERKAQHPQVAVYKVYNFEPNSASPITLMEVAEFGEARNTFVRCSPDFYRYGNVAIFCREHGIPIFNDIRTIISRIKEKL